MEKGKNLKTTKWLKKSIKFIVNSGRGKQTALFSVVLFDGIGSYFIVNSFAVVSNYTSVAIGSCRPYDDASPRNTPIPSDVKIDPQSSTSINATTSSSRVGSNKVI